MSEPTDDERAELEARQAMRAFLRRMTGVFAMVFLVGVIFSATLTSVLARGMTRAGMLAPLAAYLMIGLALTARKRWGLAFFCLVGLALHLTVIQEAAKTLAMNRETRTKTALLEIRGELEAFRAREGRFPNSLSELPSARRSPLICLSGKPTRLEVAPGERSDSGAWVYDSAAGRVSVDCRLTESSGGRWSEL